MKSVIRQIYRSSVGEPTIPTSPEYQTRRYACHEADERLREVLDDEGIQLWIKAADAQSAMQGTFSEDAFIEGFKMGVRLCLECCE